MVDLYSAGITAGMDFGAGTRRRGSRSTRCSEIARILVMFFSFVRADSPNYSHSSRGSGNMKPFRELRFGLIEKSCVEFKR